MGREPLKTLSGEGHIKVMLERCPAPGVKDWQGDGLISKGKEAGQLGPGFWRTSGVNRTFVCMDY